MAKYKDAQGNITEVGNPDLNPQLIAGKTLVPDTTRLGSGDATANMSIGAANQAKGLNPDGTPIVQAPPVITPTPPSPANIPVKNITEQIGPYISPEDTLLSDIQSKRKADAELYAKYGGQLPEEQRAAIRQDELARMQAQIDAINKAAELEVARQREIQKGITTGRLGTEGAIGARRGLLGSTFQTAAERNVEAKGAEELASREELIQSKRDLAVQGLMGKADTAAAERIAAKEKAIDEGVKSYETYLSGEKTMKKTQLTDALKSLLLSGSTADELSTLTADDIKMMADKYGLNINEVKSITNELIKGEKAAAEAKAKEILGQTKTQAEIDKIKNDIANPNLTSQDLGDRVVFFDEKGNQVSSYKKGLTPKDAEGGTGMPATVSSAQNWLAQFNSGLMSVEDIYTKLGTSKEAMPLKNELARLIAGQGGKRVFGNDDATIQAMNSQIKNIDDLMKGKEYKKIVGFIQGGAGIVPDVWNVGKQNALAIAKNLTSNQTLTALAEAKSKGITFGALSEKELGIVAESASRIAAKIIEKDGVITGFSGSEGQFVEDLKVIKEGLEKSIKGKTGTAGGQNAPDDDLLSQYGL